MKHKQDAIQEYENVMSQHYEAGLSFHDAAIAAIITLDYKMFREDSVRQRALNYARECVYGPDKAKLIHDKEQELGRLNWEVYDSFEKYELHRLGMIKELRDLKRFPHQLATDTLNEFFRKKELE